MPKFSNKSLERLDTCDVRLQEIMKEAIKYIDFTILEGHRGKAAQDEAYANKKSTLKWPNSLHNSYPSRAVDIAPYPVDWNDTAAFARLAGYIQRIADEKGYKIRWGGDWNNNFRTRDERFIDMPHIELVPTED